MKKLRFSKINLVPRYGALMTVEFLDEESDLYSWAPKIDEVEKLFLKLINVERFNKPEGKWLDRLAEVTAKAAEGAQRIEFAHKLRGRFSAYHDQKLVIEPEVGRTAVPLTPAFEVTFEFLDEWLERWIEVFLLNKLAVRLREYDQNGNVEAEYPKAEETGHGSEDIPF